MSFRWRDGRHHCDRCGTDVGNGDVQQCTVAIAVELVDTGGITIPTPVRLEFCTKPRAGLPRGCSGRVLSDANLADYRQSKETTSP